MMKTNGCNENNTIELVHGDDHETQHVTSNKFQKLKHSMHFVLSKTIRSNSKNQSNIILEGKGSHNDHACSEKNQRHITTQNDSSERTTTTAPLADSFSFNSSLHNSNNLMSDSSNGMTTSENESSPFSPVKFQSTANRRIWQIGLRKNKNLISIVSDGSDEEDNIGSTNVSQKKNSDERSVDDDDDDDDDDCDIYDDLLGGFGNQRSLTLDQEDTEDDYDLHVNDSSNLVIHYGLDEGADGTVWHHDSDAKFAVDDCDPLLGFMNDNNSKTGHLELNIVSVAEHVQKLKEEIKDLGKKQRMSIEPFSLSSSLRRHDGSQRDKISVSSRRVNKSRRQLISSDSLTFAKNFTSSSKRKNDKQENAVLEVSNSKIESTAKSEKDTVLNSSSVQEREQSNSLLHEDDPLLSNSSQAVSRSNRRVVREHPRRHHISAPDLHKNKSNSGASKSSSLVSIDSKKRESRKVDLSSRGSRRTRRHAHENINADRERQTGEDHVLSDKYHSLLASKQKKIVENDSSSRIDESNKTKVTDDSLSESEVQRKHDSYDELYSVSGTSSYNVRQRVEFDFNPRDLNQVLASGTSNNNISESSRPPKSSRRNVQRESIIFNRDGLGNLDISEPEPEVVPLSMIQTMVESSTRGIKSSTKLSKDSQRSSVPPSQKPIHSNNSRRESGVLNRDLLGSFDAFELEPEVIPLSMIKAMVDSSNRGVDGLPQTSRSLKNNGRSGLPHVVSYINEQGGRQNNTSNSMIETSYSNASINTDLTDGRVMSRSTMNEKLSLKQNQLSDQSKRSRHYREEANIIERLQK
jgi:hypothetical protein